MYVSPKDIDILILSYSTTQSPFDISYVASKLFLSGLPESKITLYSSSCRCGFSSTNHNQLKELTDRGLQYEYMPEMKDQKDRGSKSTLCALNRYFNRQNRAKYLIVTFQDVWLVHPNILKQSIDHMIKLNKDGLTYPVIVSGKFAYHTSFMLLETSIWEEYIKHPKLGKIECMTEFEIYDILLKKDLLIALPKEKAQTQYGYSYPTGTAHFHDSQSLSYYLNLHNKSYNENIQIDWSLIPKFISKHANEKNMIRLRCPKFFEYSFNDIVPTGVDEISLKRDLLNNNYVIENINGSYYCVNHTEKKFRLIT